MVLYPYASTVNSMLLPQTSFVQYACVLSRWHSLLASLCHDLVLVSADHQHRLLGLGHRQRPGLLLHGKPLMQHCKNGQARSAMTSTTPPLHLNDTGPTQ